MADLQAGNPQRPGSCQKEDLSKSSRPPPPGSPQRISDWGAMFPARSAAEISVHNRIPGIPAPPGRSQGIGPGQLQDGRRQRPVPPGPSKLMHLKETKAEMMRVGVDVIVFHWIHRRLPLNRADRTGGEAGVRRGGEAWARAGGEISGSGHLMAGAGNKLTQESAGSGWAGSGLLAAPAAARAHR